jgi:1-deoxy-D-xylulose-5-phosphate reductoisomerase
MSAPANGEGRTRACAAPAGVCVLGATGSIGASTLDVLARHPDRFRVTALSAHSRVDELVALCARHRPALAVIGDEGRLSSLREALAREGLPVRALAGRSGLVEAAQDPGTSTVVAAIVGAAGLESALAAARAGKRLLLANKESIVCAGALLLAAVREGGGVLLPVDSEHSAIHQCLAGGRAARRLVLTASGGPFRTRADLSAVTPEEACAHPRWNMGRKISVDSATLMNKGLEIIEASWLFSMPGERIDVVVHPQSVIHSMVEFDDGSVLAQLGSPDMRTPIAYALAHPERIESGSPALDFPRMGPFDFEPPDLLRFPCLRLAREALAAGGRACIALNAANEVAVGAFLERRLAFVRIPALIEAAMRGVAAGDPVELGEVLEVDALARARARAGLSG